MLEDTGKYKCTTVWYFVTVNPWAYTQAKISISVEEAISKAPRPPRSFRDWDLRQAMAQLCETDSGMNHPGRKNQ